MYTINLTDAKAIVEKISVMALTEDSKANFAFFQKKAGEDKYLCSVRVTDKAEQLTYAFTVPADGEQAEIQLTVSAKKFVEIVNSLLTFGKDIEWEVVDSMLALSIPTIATLKLPVCEATEEIAFVPNDAISLAVEGKAFNTLLRKGGSFSDAKNANVKARASLLSVEFESKKLEMTSTNGNIVAYATCDAASVQTKKEGSNAKAGIPAEAVAKILKLASTVQTVKVMFTDTQLVVGAGTAMYVVTLAKDPMDVSSFLAAWSGQPSEAGVTVDAEAIISAISVLTVADSSCKGYKLSISESRLELIISTKDGEQKVSIPVSATVGDFAEDNLGISRDYLEKIVKNLNKGNVTIRTRGEQQFPFIITNGTVTEPGSNAVCYCMKMAL